MIGIDKLAGHDEPIGLCLKPEQLDALPHVTPGSTDAGRSTFGVVLRRSGKVDVFRVGRNDADHLVAGANFASQYSVYTLRPARR